VSSATPSPPGTETARTAVWTVLDLLRWTTEHFERQGIESARLDAECLLAFALGVERLRLYIDFDKPVNEAERAAFRDLVRRRAAQRVPVSQLVGAREFWSLALKVTADVLTPRPETETLVSAALDLLPDPDAPARVLDVGTGSGAIALAIARERPRAVITATDISQESLKIAQENAERHEMAERIQTLEGDLLDPVAGATFDLVVSNPPYLAESEREALPPELAHEPERALFAGADGLAVLARLAAGVPALLAPGAGVALEIAPAQARDVARMLEAAGLTQVGVRRDLGGRPRVVTALQVSTA
jgi:release factor glutamine methyltransferase